jgi:hypothetical protein
MTASSCRLFLLLPVYCVLASIAQAQTVPTPDAVLGFRPGADFHLASYDQALDYFQRLDAASDRVQLIEVGRTSEGRAWYMAVISSAENLANLARYREIALRLAHPAGLGDDEAKALAREGRAIVHIDQGLHATEVAAAQQAIQLAYDLVTGDSDPEIVAILDNVILMLWFSINPDGQNMVAEWYHSNVGTPYEVSPMPWLYQRYIGHDNNRDGYMLNMIESRVVTRMLREWEPQIVYNHHQTAPFPARIWIPPFAEPVSEFVHPLMWRTVNLIGMSMAQALEERGQRGAMHMGRFDDWYPGFIDHANNFHNIASLLTETGLYRYATPHFYTVSDFPARSQDLRPGSLYSSPWEGGWWHLRDAVEYMETASISVLDFAAKYKVDLLYNRYQAGRDVIAEYREAPPYAYFIPQTQRDPVAPVELLRRLAFNGIDIYQLGRDVRHAERTIAAGSWVIPMDQENANFVRQLLAVQQYPDLRVYPEGPPDQPYDISGWTLPYQMDVSVIEAAVPLTEQVRAAMAPVQGEALPWDADVTDAATFDSPPGVGFNSNALAAGITPLPGRARGSGSALIVDMAQNNSFRAVNRAWHEGGQVRFQPGAPGEGGAGGTSGHWVLSGLNARTIDTMVRDYALQAERGRASGVPVRQPRIGLYRPWRASMDEGWTRWLLEQYGFAFTSVYNYDVAAGDLRDRFDVILIADMSASQITDGYAKGSVPPRYAGGIGDMGVRALDEFVRSGGTLVTWNSSSLFAMEALHLPVKNVVADLPREEFFLAGSIVAMTVDPSHPAMSGMPVRSKVFVERSPVFTVEDEFAGSIVAKYEEEGSPLLSGYLLGDEHLHGFAAGVDVHHGEGHVILLGMRPQWRGQPFGTFRIVFNAALYTSPVADAAPTNDEFWTPPAEDEDAAESRAVGGGNGRRMGRGR